MAHVQGSDRRLTAYSYANEMVAYRFRHGILYHDSGTNLVMWQCGDHRTPWHGEFLLQNFAGLDCLHIRFQASYDGRGSPNLHSVVLLPIHPETYLGLDYRSRFVEMIPLAQWAFDPETVSWQILAEWTPATHEWIVVLEG